MKLSTAHNSPRRPPCLDLGFTPLHIFTMLIMAAASTVMTASLLRVLLPRTGHVIPLHVEA